MDKLTIPVTGIVSWAPSSQGLRKFAVGSATGSIDDNFEVNSTLEIYSVSKDFSKLKRTHRVEPPSSFTSLMWGLPGGEPTFLTGNDVGETMLIPMEVFEDPSIFEKSPILTKRLVPVFSAAFSPLRQTNYSIAYEDGIVYVVDSMRPDATQEFSPRVSSGPSPLCGFAWNAKVEPIFATSVSTGTVCVWDTRKRGPAVTLFAGTGAAGLSWNPLVGTVLSVACSEQGRPCGSVWDLRSKNKSLFDFDDGANGTSTSVSWNPHDSRFVASSGPDGGYIWNADRDDKWSVVATPGAIGSPTNISHRLLSTLPPSEKIQWSPNIPGLLVQSGMGEVRLTYRGDLRQNRQNGVPDNQFPDAPNWIPRRTAGQRLVQGTVAGVTTVGGDVKVSLSRISTCPGFIERAAKLAEQLEVSPDPVIARYAEGGESRGFGKEWVLLRAFAAPETRKSLRDFLGFVQTEEDAVEKKEEPEAVDTVPPTVSVLPPIDLTAAEIAGKIITDIPEPEPQRESAKADLSEDVEGFFEELGGEEEMESSKSELLLEQVEEIKKQHSKEPASVSTTAEEESEKSDEPETDTGLALDTQTRRLLELMVCGRVDKCIDILLESADPAFALLFAYRLSSEKFQQTSEAVLEKMAQRSGTAPLIELVRALSSPEALVTFIIRCARYDWRAAAAAALTYCHPSKLPDIALMIAEQTDDLYGKAFSRLLANEVEGVFEEWGGRCKGDVESLLEFSVMTKMAMGVFGQFKPPAVLSRLQALLIAEGGGNLVEAIVPGAQAPTNERIIITPAIIPQNQRRPETLPAVTTISPPPQITQPGQSLQVSPPPGVHSQGVVPPPLQTGAAPPSQVSPPANMYQSMHSYTPPSIPLEDIPPPPRADTYPPSTQIFMPPPTAQASFEQRPPQPLPHPTSQSQQPTPAHPVPPTVPRQEESIAPPPSAEQVKYTPPITYYTPVQTVTTPGGTGSASLSDYVALDSTGALSELYIIYEGIVGSRKTMATGFESRVLSLFQAVTKSVDFANCVLSLVPMIKSKDPSGVSREISKETVSATQEVRTALNEHKMTLIMMARSAV